MFPNGLRNGFPLRKTERLIALSVALLLAGGFTLAAFLKPDPRGYGTHQQLGMPPCTFRLVFELPCPACGMTTCFSHSVRGQFVSAARANFGGMLLALLAAVMLPWSLWSAATGRLVGIRNPQRALLIVTSLVMAICLAQWGMTLVVQGGREEPASELSASTD